MKLLHTREKCTYSLPTVIAKKSCQTLVQPNTLNMKVTDKKFLNVHQTIGPLTVSTTVTSSSKEEAGSGSGSTKSEKLLVSPLKKSGERTLDYSLMYTGPLHFVMIET